MNSLRKAMLIAGICLFGTTGVTNASVIDFEAGLDSFFTYSGVSTTGSVLAGSGYNNVLAFTSSSQVAYNPNATSPSTFSMTAASSFDLTSFVIAGAWGTQTLTIDGLLNNVLSYTTPLAVSLSAQLFSPNWSNIDEIRITIGSDFVNTYGGGGDGQHWALDNITLNENTAVPEPASLALLGLGLAGLGFARRKKQKAA